MKPEGCSHVRMLVELGLLPTEVDDCLKRFDSRKSVILCGARNRQEQPLRIAIARRQEAEPSSGAKSRNAVGERVHRHFHRKRNLVRELGFLLLKPPSIRAQERQKMGRVWLAGP